MSLRMLGKGLRRLGISALLLAMAPAVSWAQGCGSCAVAAPTCNTSCQWLHCPAPYKHCQEGPPRLHWHCGCPHPVCNPCDLPHFGYWETCWYRWPFPPTPCPEPTPASMVTLNPPQMAPLRNDPRLPRSQPSTGPVTPAPQGFSPNPRTPTPGASDELPQPRQLRPGL